MLVINYMNVIILSSGIHVSESGVFLILLSAVSSPSNKWRWGGMVVLKCSPVPVSLSWELFSFVVTNSSSYIGKLGVMIDGNCDLCRIWIWLCDYRLVLNVNWLPLQGMSVGVLWSCAWMQIMLRRCYDVDRQLTTMVSWAGFMIM